MRRVAGRDDCSWVARSQATHRGEGRFFWMDRKRTSLHSAKKPSSLLWCPIKNFNVPPHSHQPLDATWMQWRKLTIEIYLFLSILKNLALQYLHAFPVMSWRTPSKNTQLWKLGVLYQAQCIYVHVHVNEVMFQKLGGASLSPEFDPGELVKHYLG
jgi:hypothetical protein